MMRLVDANLNRIGEGLRVLEDVARFILSDAALSQELRAMRHELAIEVAPFHEQLLTARDSASDVGALIQTTENRSNASDVVIANAKRVQESLRVMEEFAKLPDLALNSTKFNQIRFRLYELERELVFKLIRGDRKQRVRGLCVVMDTEALRGRDGENVARRAIRGGAKMIQLRDKRRVGTELLELAQKLKRVCDEGDTLFMINDYLDLALACDADGIHLGQGDLPVGVARRLLPGDRLIGCSTATVPQAMKAESDGADYISVGSVYFTHSKEQFTQVGLERVRQIKQAVSLPVLAIGGIDKTNVAGVVESGADGVAVINSVLGVDDVEGAARSLTEAFGDEEK
jgi:thiamine-phosphate pyrophosphorylase